MEKRVGRQDKDECRMSIDECRIKEFFLFYLLKKAERAYSAEMAMKAGSDIHNSFRLGRINLHSSFHEVSYKVSAVRAQEFKAEH